MAEEHVRGRMPTESNPGNRKPAIPPVFDTTGEEDYRRVTPDNPLPTKDKDLDERLTAIENKLDSVIENGAINTQLSGSKVEEITLHNAIAIRDTDQYNSEIFDVSHLGGNKIIHIWNGTDQPIDVRIFAFPKNSAHGVSKSTTVVARAPNILTSEDLVFLGEPMQRTLVRVSASTPPTSGTVSAWLEGGSS